MRPRWLALSVSLNLLLLGVVVYAARRPSGVADARSTSLLIASRAVRAVPGPVSVPPSQVLTAPVAEAFHWRQLESEDYRVFAANLQAIGCPEPTVRDMIEADVNKLFQRRVKELVDPLQPRFWQLVSHEPALEEVVKEKEAQLETLEKERDALLDEVLGQRARQRNRAQQLAELEQMEGRKQFLDFLSSDKLAQCLAQDEKFRRLQEELANLQPPLGDQERHARLQALRAQQEREFRELLSPEELAEYQLRNSRFADLRFRLTGFELTEEEMKQIIRLQEQSVVDTSRPDAAERQKQQREAFETLLGEQRFAEFERAQDQRYQELYQVANRLQLPVQVAADAYAMRRAAEEQVRRVRDLPTLSAEQRQELLKAIRAETERSLAGVFGTQAFELYQGRWSQWLGALEKAD